MRPYIFLSIVLAFACGGCTDDSGSVDSGADSPQSGGTGGESGEGGGATELDATAPLADASDIDAGGEGGTDSTDDVLFAPDIPRVYMGPVVNPVIEIIAHTIAATEDGNIWLAAVQSRGTEPLCAIAMPTWFLDENGTELAYSSPGTVHAPLYRNSGGGLRRECLGPGDIGMVMDASAIQGIDVSLIASIEYDFTAVNLVNVVPAKTEVTFVLDVEPHPLGGNRFTGTIENGSSDTVDRAQVHVFGLNEVGRPLIGGDAFIDAEIEPGGTAMFETSSSFSVTAADLADTVAFISPF